ncbi:MAG: hypothetical protein IT544_02270 [Rhodobacteraceae bacterium]|jgi:hypothetical protein|nr:hypothetical protein [Paracoccaceae bacterium]
MIRVILKWLAGGLLDRVLDTVDRRIEADTDRGRLRAEIIREYYKTRADWMRAGGFWLMMLFTLPLAVWWGTVIVYSILWCAGCAYPQSWTIAALPRPLDEWAGLIVMAIFGVIGVSQIRR